MIRRQLFRAGLALLAIFALPASAWSQNGSAADPVAAAVALEGQVYLLRDGRQVPLRPDMTVADSDEILTFPDGRVRLRFTDGSLVTIGPSSRCLVALQRRAPEREDRFLELVEGILRLLTAEAGGSGIEVRTRSAIATPRGTDWIVERKPGTTAVFVVEGQVAVAGTAGGLVVLAPGFGTDVSNGAPPVPPKRWGQARVDDVLERTALP